MNPNAPKGLLIEMEQAFLTAYKAKDAETFKKNFARDYVGIANDGMQTVDKEIEKMGRFNIRELHMENEKVTFPTESVGIVTYKMVSEGQLDGKEFSGVLYASTVYVERDGQWKAVLHTESMGQ